MAAISALYPLLDFMADEIRVRAWYMTAAFALSNSSPTATRTVAVAAIILSLRVYYW
jgi:hypothetical protein